jgi:hypothetical protein
MVFNSEKLLTSTSTCKRRERTAKQNTENSKQIFPEMKQCDLSPNSYFYVSVTCLYIPTIGLLIQNCCKF